MAKIFTIGDSISQGFMSGGAAFTHLSYSAILANSLSDTSHRLHKWELKLKVDLEKIFRTLNEKYGTDIRLLEWVGALRTINNIMDESEEYYETGEGKIGAPINNAPHYYHNCAVEGMDVADAWIVTPQLCLDTVRSNEKGSKDKMFQSASDSFYRNAYRILNPTASPRFMQSSALKWLQHAAEVEGVENTIIWLGANNALGTIFKLRIDQTSGDGSILEAKRGERQKKNLWHPNDFHAEYDMLLEKAVDAMKNNKFEDWKIFLGTVPLVTIAPLLRGFADERLIMDPSGRTNRQFRYYQNYTYFPLSDAAALKSDRLLNFPDALFIDKSIIKYNESIVALAKKYNQQLKREAIVVAPISDALTDLAWKRNSGAPPYQIPDELQWLYPQLNTKYYDVSPDGRILSGGIFSLDGVHPTAIGQGIIAHEFLKAIKAARPDMQHEPIAWDNIIRADTLRSKPISNMQELYQHDMIIDFLLNTVKILNVKD